MSDEQPTWLARNTHSSEGANIGERLSRFAAGKSRTCPICGSAVEKIWCWHGIEYAVLYNRPCNCRLGCWEDAPAWAREAGIVEDDNTHEDEPTVFELIADGIEVELLPEHYQIIYKAQEAAGQKRLPGFMPDEDES